MEVTEVDIRADTFIDRLSISTERDDAIDPTSVRDGAPATDTVAVPL